MRVRVNRLTLDLKRTFTIAHGSRTAIEGLEVIMDSFNARGRGTAFVPSYYGDVDELIKQIKELSSDEMTIRKAVEDGDLHPFARAAVLHAMLRLEANEKGIGLRNVLKLPKPAPIESFYTIGICPLDQLAEELVVASEFSKIKLKLDSAQDIERIEAYCELTNKPFAVDANQAWKSDEDISQMLALLEERECILIEQPYPKDDLESHKQLMERTTIPVILDESVTRVEDIARMSTFCDGVNIKLLKLGGIDKAMEAIEEARKHDLEVLLGCMTEDASGIEMSLLLAHMADWVDLDGAFLLKNPGNEVEYSLGKVAISS